MLAGFRSLRATSSRAGHLRSTYVVSRSFSAVAPGDDRPLAGIKVVDLTRVLAGPTATMMLSDLGADVIKVESPNGDDTRIWAPPEAKLIDGAPRPDLPAESAYFMCANRNKRSVILNLKNKEAMKVMYKLIQDADVFVENYVPGKLEKFGLGWEKLKEINPRLIYCSVTGYGSTGPYASSPGYDVVIEAEAGLMHITGEKEGPPVKVGVAVTDILTGHYATSGILAALLKRGKTGKGTRVEASLFESQIATLANIGSNYLVAGQEATRWGTSHPSVVPYQVFPTKDGYMMIAGGNDNQFKTLCGPNIFNKPEWLEDERFATNAARVVNRKVLVDGIIEVLSHKSTDEWTQVITGKGIPFAPINNIAQTFSHPQAIARKVVEEIDHPRAGKVKIAAAAVSYDGEKPKMYRPPPYLGQHTIEVLEGIGYSAAEIDELKSGGATA
ncbi:hypothetical protein CcaverHIS002_0203160 [Cutaneotrichosporon cavernicola]|uniref:CAIB/BAIF family enzyme n=1 Tax=Cutaneotrichosporon cavernicola TaxID=279322 RepID=A0AA48IID5_9TREE|nr:uncharacterized protein CcaverHIS019_0203150 [Cutaneotrichosporon cavernicola]BEI81156.1 hypothetical protein CcaverHIS002_0203160 [Cutaneotrichosporon cavernicola]BEI88953.1 hypothetical protein CcaverHIS019_0203150 [Cutaneotrichosporon cavernicola]BEI96730.1 hypothetical protein CcaverHIS631_0203190 [Cutaneotrichosporon cavernicola]BEJ04502.1 hypothetical protein CcaverHIS641_0203190 [Cutaneotrichosporon cavernicola]